MKLKKEFLVHQAGQETLLVPTGDADFSGVVRGNQTFGSILALLKEETDEASVIKALSLQFDAPEEAIARDVKKAISHLQEIGALDA